MSSVCCIVLYFATKCPLAVTLSQVQLYLNFFTLLITKVLVKVGLEVTTIAPLSFITRSYCSQSGSKGIIVSHLQAVVPYRQGRSHNIISIDLSGICCINSKQSP